MDKSLYGIGFALALYLIIASTKFIGITAPHAYMFIPAGILAAGCLLMGAVFYGTLK